MTPIETRSRWGAAAPVAVGAVLLLATVALQYFSGFFPREFGADAASHYVSSLMVHDYLLYGHLSNPLHYLSDYHSHYPLVGIGAWPPFFYLVEALWMMVFSTSRVAVLLLSATMTAATATIIYIYSRRVADRWLALLAAACFVAAPVVQDATGDLMLDVPVGFFALLSMLAFARYLASGKARYAALFGFVAAAALMVKGNAGCLVLLPPLALLLGRRLDCLRRWSFWLPLPIVAIGAGPWYALTHQRGEAGFRFASGLDFATQAFSFNGAAVIDALGPVVFVLALVGLMRSLFARGHAPDPLTACAAALALSVFVFQLLVPVGLQERYVIPALAPLLILAAGEAERCRLWLAGPLPRSILPAAAVYGAVLLSVVLGLAQMPVAEQSGIVEAARQVWRARLPENPAVLLATDAGAEPGLISALIMLDPHRPSLFVVRGSRLLGGGGYNNRDYQPRYADAQQVTAAIDRYAIPLVVFRNPGRPGDWEHIAQVAAARQADPARWRSIYRDDRHVPNIELFQLAGNDQKTADAAALTALSAPNALRAVTSPPPGTDQH